MYCRKCGTQLIEDSQFCPKCGTRVEESSSSSNAAESEKPAAVDSGKSKPATSPSPNDDNPLMFPVEEIETRRRVESGSTRRTPSEKPSSAPAEEEQAPLTPSGEGELALPPDLLPKPSGTVNPNQLDEVEKERKSKLKKERKSKKRWHPLDVYTPLKERFQFGGCGLLFFLLIIVPVLAVGVLGWIQYNLFVDQKGFESIVKRTANVIEVPEKDTVYWGASVLYEGEETDAEVAFIGGSWWLGGTFREKVYFRGYQLNLLDGARFEKGLDVTAFRFEPGTAEIEGDLTGSIAIQR